MRGLPHDPRRIVPVKRAQLVGEERVAVGRHHADPVVASGVADERLVPIGVAVHVGDHEAAVAAAGRREPRAVDVALAQQPVGAGLDVGEFLFAVTAGDRLEPLLAEARGAVIIHRRDDIALAREHLRVPAEMPCVLVRRMRSAVIVCNSGHFLPGSKFGG
jgi:hypothetical protein